MQSSVCRHQIFRTPWWGRVADRNTIGISNGRVHSFLRHRSFPWISPNFSLLQGRSSFLMTSVTRILRLPVEIDQFGWQALKGRNKLQLRRQFLLRHEWLLQKLERPLWQEWSSPRIPSWSGRGTRVFGWRGMGSIHPSDICLPRCMFRQNRRQRRWPACDGRCSWPPTSWQRNPSAPAPISFQLHGPLV